MITPIIDELKSRLTAALPFITRITGLIKAKEILNGKKRVVLPVGVAETADGCKGGKIIEFVPNKDEALIIYFQALTTQAREVCVGRYIDYTTTFRLVGWANLNRLEDAATNEKLLDTCLIEAKIAAALPQNLGQIGPYFSAVQLLPAAPEAKSPAIFRGFNFGDNTNIFNYPYDYFALRFNLNYRFLVNCVGDINAVALNDC